MRNVCLISENCGAVPIGPTDKTVCLVAAETGAAPSDPTGQAAGSRALRLEVAAAAVQGPTSQAEAHPPHDVSARITLLLPGMTVAETSLLLRYVAELLRRRAPLPGSRRDRVNLSAIAAAAGVPLARLRAPVVRRLIGACARRLGIAPPARRHATPDQGRAPPGQSG